MVHNLLLFGKDTFVFKEKINSLVKQSNGLWSRVWWNRIPLPSTTGAVALITGYSAVTPSQWYVSCIQKTICNIQTRTHYPANHTSYCLCWSVVNYIFEHFRWLSLLPSIRLTYKICDNLKGIWLIINNWKCVILSELVVSYVIFYIIVAFLSYFHNGFWCYQHTFIVYIIITNAKLAKNILTIWGNYYINIIVSLVVFSFELNVNINVKH